MHTTHPPLSTAALLEQRMPAALGRDNLLSFIESIVGPGVYVISLWALAYYFDGDVRPPYLILSIMVFAVTFPGQSRLQTSIPAMVLDVSLNWLGIAFLLLVTGISTGYIRDFSRQALLTWLWLAPVAELGVCLTLRAAAPTLLKLQGDRQRAIVVGMNDQGLALAARIEGSPYSWIELVGFVDSRQVSRLPTSSEHKLLGKLDDLISLVQVNRVQLIYMSLPMASQPRILQVLDELKDTTVSIYFVPDMFVTDLIQGRPDSVCGTPIISVCDTPFRGTNGALKRLSDIVLSLLILLLISPVLIVVAVGVKLSSPGPVIFKQRRYGQDGEEILIYKFRSMTVTEDGNNIQQAQKADKRITPLGAFIRKTSLDELPQFVNVLQGRMSIVGPRPHAVAHNELYRKLIKGYMVRHKVKPGITGWAQVNGYRGETNTLDKMKSRIEFDLDYLRNWSLRLDIKIILKTIQLVFRDQQAY